MEDDELRVRGLRDPGRVVEHPDRHVQLLPALGVAHEAGDRRVDGEDDAGVPAESAEALGPLVVHPELALEVDLAGRPAARDQRLDRSLGALARGDAGGAELQGHAATVAGSRARYGCIASEPESIAAPVMCCSKVPGPARFCHHT